MVWCQPLDLLLGLPLFISWLTALYHHIVFIKKCSEFLKFLSWLKIFASYHYFIEKYIVRSQFFLLHLLVLLHYLPALSITKSKSSLIFLPLLFLQAAENSLSLNFSNLTKLCLGICCSISAFHWKLCPFCPADLTNY